nr:unnamed protein product [Haemonchus contortus]
MPETTEDRLLLKIMPEAKLPDKNFGVSFPKTPFQEQVFRTGMLAPRLRRQIVQRRAKPADGVKAQIPYFHVPAAGFTCRIITDNP